MGVGHRWVRRLFIDRQYKTNCKNPEENENPDDYTFIFATVDDNQILLKKSPTYLRTLANMPEDLREAYRYGNWDIIGGNYFKEFTIGKHTTAPFPIPPHWPRYRSMDYGLDCLSVGWWAVDEDGRSWLYRSFEGKNLIVSKAANAIKDNTMPGENIVVTYAPDDIWARAKDSGRSMAETFMIMGIGLVKANRNRVQGHMLLKEAMGDIPLKDAYVRKIMTDRLGSAPTSLPGMMVFDTCEKVIEDLRDIQADDDNPNDCSKDPHEITHTVDMCRYYIISRVSAAELEEQERQREEFEEDPAVDYNDFMTGGEITESYMRFA